MKEHFKDRPGVKPVTIQGTGEKMLFDPRTHELFDLGIKVKEFNATSEKLGLFGDPSAHDNASVGPVDFKCYQRAPLWRRMIGQALVLDREETERQRWIRAHYGELCKLINESSEWRAFPYEDPTGRTLLEEEEFHKLRYDPLSTLKYRQALINSRCEAQIRKHQELEYPLRYIYRGQTPADSYCRLSDLIFRHNPCQKMDYEQIYEETYGIPD